MITNRPILILMTLVMANANLSATERVITTIGVGYNPSYIAITPNGQLAYVANNNNGLVTSGSTVNVLDLVRNRSILSIADISFNQPFTVTINPAGTIAYVTNSAGTTISMINIATNTVTGTISGFHGPSGMVINPANPTIAYVNNYNDNSGSSGNGITVSVVNLNSNTVTSTIVVDLAPAALAITPDGAYVYVANYVDGNPGTGTVSVIRTSDNTVIGKILGFSGPFQITIAPDGKHAYVTNFGSNNFAPVGTTISVIDLSTNTISATIKLGIQPAGVAVTPDSRLVYASNYNTLYLGAGNTNLTAGTGTVNIIDANTNTVLTPIVIVGQSPGAIAISPDGTLAYVTNYSSNNVSVIDIVDRMWLTVGN
jgi:YVTN family beta-propeller protein